MSPKIQSVLPKMVAFFAFILAFCLGPLQFSDCLQKLPGDFGDARLNAYFLEHAYQYIIGGVDSLWHMSFYYPFPFVLGFSENNFGLSPLYMLSRVFGFDSYSSFLHWYMVGYVLNYGACLYAFRKMGLSRWAAILGALVFAFGLPVTAHSNHAQLHHRFAVPLIAMCYVSFLQTRDVRSLFYSYLWLVWQFFICVYTGFFSALMLMAMSFCYFFIPYMRQRITFKAIWREVMESLNAEENRSSLKSIALSGVAASAAMIWLFYPYLQVKSLYGFERSWEEITAMLPRIQSYIFARGSHLWDFNLEAFNRLPLWWEHQMFPGMVPFILAILGGVVSLSRSVSLAPRLIAGSFLFLVSITLWTGGSWWEYFYSLPLFSAIRAMSRIDTVFLLFYGFLAGFFFDCVFKENRAIVLAFTILSGFFIYESSAVKTYWIPKAQWEAKVDFLAKQIPESVKPGSPLFFAQQSKPGYEFEHEISAMWVGLKYGYPIINGYSGNWPKGYNQTFGRDCRELGRRMAIYEDFASQHGLRSLKEVNRDIVTIGFKDCP